MRYGFITELVAVKLREAGSRGRAQWRLLTELAYNSQLHGMIVVPAGFVTDFASVPRMPIVFLLAGDTAHASAVVHDYLVRVQFPACKISWARAADVFLEAMKHEKTPAWRRAIMHWAVAVANPANTWETQT